MKVGRLKRRADELAAYARADRAAAKTHAGRVLVIARRRVGSTAGLAISFSLGFMAGTGTANEHEKDTQGSRKHGARRERSQRGPTLIYRLAHGPAGETATRLGMALLVRSLMKLREGGIEDMGGPPHATNAAEIQ